MVIGTWNLENLCRPLPPGGPPSNRCAAQDEATYQAKLEGLAATIDHLAPDLLGVQEVGSHEALTDLVDRLGGDWHIALSTHPDRRGIRAGFLSPRPLTVVEDRTAFPDHLPPVRVEDDGTMIRRMGRGGLVVRWSPVPGHTVGVAVCHLKSKLLTFPGNRHSTDDEELRARYASYALYRRAAEAVTMRFVADRLLQGDGRTHEVIVMGDLNDEFKAATTQILYGPPGSQIGTGGFQDTDLGDPRRLWNLAPRILEQGGFSRVFEGQKELIDHILVSQALLPRLERVFTGTEKLPTVDGAHPAAPHDSPSDHAPVLAVLDY
ncbi:endonuclease/exonuclease/phosphatase family protein [Streptomyces xanthophaeus]|nr:endonuclease/exonuclease/phosphatase family protein [Streptomyces xanthophaeus]WKD36995.1 endonuclease/exonuclease/phosphatase family protein [Streptomyces xanthophaeus]